jgi:hypothetical protein
MDTAENVPPQGSPADPRRRQAARLDGKALARSRREGMRRRARRIRRSIAGVALALFTAAFLGIYVQLASGHDPALTAVAKRQAATTSTLTSTTSSTTPATSEESASTSEASSGEASETSSSSSAVTSSQS